jgi:S-adenosylmethionine synthetase
MRRRHNANLPEIVVTALRGPSFAARPVEIVERKGRGHPDTLCDQAAEALSIALSREYLSRVQHILHHNVDKAVLCGGAATPRFGGGEVVQPVRFIHVGRATLDVMGERIDAATLATRSTRNVFSQALRYFDPQSHLEVETMVRPTSSELAGLFESGAAIPRANDTSMGCGYAPLSQTEQLVLDVDRHLMDPATLKRHPFLGEDIKVLAIRVRRQIELTVAAAFVGRHVASLQEYLDQKRAIAEDIFDFGRARVEKLARVTVNAADRPERQEVYLTVTGTSAEAGDDGQVGRGNRVSGLITPSRPMTLEALAGKNPVSHVGKLYNLWAQRIAARVALEPDAEEVVCQLASRIGAPITEPQVVFLGVRGAAAHDRQRLARRLRDELDELPGLWREIVEGTMRLF